METKLQTLKNHWRSGDAFGALRIAAKFPRLGAERDAITKAWAAIQNPCFYRQIGKDPQQLIEDGFNAMRSKWGLG
jgi:hypothetical protein